MTESSDGDLPKVALITGASRGIGYALAKALAGMGVHIIATARTQGGLEALDDEIKSAGGKATLAPLNITDYDGLDRLGAKIFERWGRLDILVGNAGVLGPLSPLGHIEIPAFEKVMNVNLVANWRLIRAMDPLLKRADQPRILFISSSAVRKCKAYWGGYSVSKAALEALARTYANEFQQRDACVNLVNPGPTRTAMRKEAMPGEDPQTLPTADEIAEKILPLLAKDCTANGQLLDIPSGILSPFTHA